MTPALLPLKHRSCLVRENPPPEACLAVGRHYLDAADESMTPYWRRSYEHYALWTDRLFRLIHVKVHFTEKDPYSSTQEMRGSVLREREIRIFSGGDEHPLLARQSNLRGRAVHDVFAHLVCGCPFTATGEFNAFEAQAAIYPVEVRPLLFCEIVGQTCAFLAKGCVHAEQKVVKFGDGEQERAEVMRRQFPKGMGLAGAVENGLLSPAVFDVARETGYALRYLYAVLETQRPAKVEAFANPGRLLALGYAPKWAPWLQHLARAR